MLVEKPHEQKNYFVCLEFYFVWSDGNLTEIIYDNQDRHTEKPKTKLYFELAFSLSKKEL